MGVYTIFHNRIKIKIFTFSLFVSLLLGLVYVLPETTPVAEAGPILNLFISAENPAFSNYFSGTQVIEVVVNDFDIDDTAAIQPEPDVTVNGKTLRMVQATDGIWYGYFADRTQAQLADATQPAASGEGLDFGEFCNTLSNLNDGTGGSSVLFTDTVGIAIASEATVGGVQGTTPITPSTACLPGSIGPFNTIHVVRESQIPTPESGLVDTGQIGIDTDAWPFVQLYDFTPTGNVIVIYNKGGGSQSATLTFDSVSSSVIDHTLDRFAYLQNAEVLATLTEPQFNVDPTDEDSWTFSTVSGSEQVYYQAFDENGLADADGTAGMVDIAPSLGSLMFGTRGKITVDHSASGSTVTEFGDNNDQVYPSSTPISEQMTFTENSAISGIFTNYDETGNSNWDTLLAAPSGETSTITYDGTTRTALILNANGKIVFMSQRDGNAEIYSMNADGTGQTRLTNNVASDVDPIWSPDGTKITFRTDRDGNNEIYVMNADGTGPTNISNNAAGEQWPSWSPDGAKITFNSNRDGNTEIYTMNADGTGQTRLTNNVASDVDPSWSPDGLKITFYSQRDGNHEIYTMNADGTGQTRLTNDPAIDQQPNWSPDGTTIAFSTLRDGDAEVYIMDADGTGQTNISNNAAFDEAPSWSPDGTKITFASNRDGLYEIYTMNADGTGQTNISNNPAGDNQPSWGTAPNTITVPDAPTGLVATPAASTEIFLNWTAPYNGGSPITGYQIEEDSGSGFSIRIADTGTTATTDSINALTPSALYTYRVSAINAIGIGPVSNSASATTLPPPPPTVPSVLVYLATLGVTGVNGSDNSHFDDPRGVAVDSTGKIYVSDFGNERVQVFNSAGVYQSTIGVTDTRGNDNAHFHSPIDLAIDSLDNLYVVDHNNHRVQKFDSAGVHQLTFGTGNAGSGNNQFFRPWGVEVDSLGNVYVVDNRNHRVQKFNSAGVYQSTIGVTDVLGSDNAHFNLPTGIAIDSLNNLYVADRINNRVQIFNSAGVYQSTIGVVGFGGPPDNAHIGEPTGLEVDLADNLYVTGGHHRVQKFNSAGVYLSTLGEAGVPGIDNAHFNDTDNAAFDSLGNLYVVDKNNHRVQIFGPNIIELDSEQYEVNTGGIVTVTDSAANLSPAVIDTVLVPMASTTDETGFSVLLSETNVNNGIFVSPQIIFSSAATNAGLNILHAPAGSTVYANYIETDSALIIPTTGASGTPDALRFDSDLYVQESSGLVKVIHAAANTVSTSKQTITVHVSSLANPTGFDIPLLEDANNSGTFTTQQAITFTLGSSQAPNRLQISDPSDSVTATYSTFTPATATIVRPFSPPIETGIVDPAVDIGCSYDTDNDGLCDDMEDQVVHPGFLLIEHPDTGFTYEYGGATCKPLIDDLNPIGNDMTVYGSLATTPACPDINTRDIYIEIDYMTNHKPDPSALVQVVRTFESAPDPDGSGPIKPGIKLHLQVDEDIDFHQVSIPQNDLPPFDAANPHGGYFQIKQEKFRTEEERSGALGDPQFILDTKRQAFRYALFGHNYNEAPGSSGWAEIFGNDIMISLGEFERHVGSPSQQSGTLFHEIGHSIRLDHSGNAETPRCKSNYISAMSYAFQFPTFVANRQLDFSRSAMTTLTEGTLSESAGFGRTSPPGLTAVYGGASGGVALSPVKTAKTNDATMGIVLDGTTLYITDPGNNRVRKITNAFTTTSTFGSSGTTDGLFKSPEGLAFNTTHIIVADSGNNRIQIFLKSNLSFAKKTGTLGSGLGQFNSPEGVGINSTHIIVADTGNDRLQRFSKSLLSPIIVGSSGTGPGQFKSPWGVAFDASGNLYVVDSGNNRIQKFGPNGVFIEEVGTRGSGPGQFISPRGIAISAGIVYVADTGNHRIQKFTTGLDLVTPPSEFGIFGTGNGQFNSTEGVAVGGTPSHIYVTDTGNKRVQKFLTSSLGFVSAYAPTGSSAFKVSVPVPVNFNRVAPSTETVSQPIHVLSGVPGCAVADGSAAVTLYGVNDWANIDLRFRDSNFFSDGQTQDPAALQELTAGDNNAQLSSTIIILNELIQALEPAEFSDAFAGAALQDSLNDDLTNANTLVIAEDLAGALGILQGTVQTDVNALPITIEAEDKKVEILLALQNAINAIQSALEPATVSQIFADDDTATTNEDVPVDIPVLTNDGSDAGDVITIVDSFPKVTPKGVVTDNGDNTLKYTPNAGQSGADSFTYTISNLAGQTDSATVTINIIPVAPQFNLKWGTFGTSNGQFKNPIGIDVDSAGKVYVTDSGNNRIQKFSSTGTFDRKWGSSGTSNGQFKNPLSLHIDSADKVYVTDSGNNRIQKFSSTGTFDRKWGSSGTSNGQFKNPTGIGIYLATNKVYVSDSDNNRIQKFSSTGTFEGKWGTFGTLDGQFKKPRGVAVDTAGNVYVADSVNNRIQKFSSTGIFILQWGSSGTNNGQFKNPTGVDVDSFGNVYVVDTDNHRIQKFSSTGTFIVKWGSFGTANGQFKNPIGIAVDSADNVYIGDTGNHRIQKFVP